MTITITYFGGRQESYNEVRYTSIYPQKSSGPMIMRIEFLNSAYPSITIDLEIVENITTIQK